jgi:hypothetical protein
VSDEPWQWADARRDEALRTYGSVEAWRSAIDAALAELPVSGAYACEACRRRGQVYDLRRVATTSDSYKAGRRCANCIVDVVGLVFTLDALQAAPARKRRSA